MPDYSDLDLIATRRAFPITQEILRGPVARLVAEEADIGWHGTTVSPEDGATAVVEEGGEFEDLVGDVLRVWRPESRREVFVLVISSTKGLPTDLSLSRRAFFALAPLWRETIEVSIEVI